MNTHIVLAFTALTTASTAAFGSSDPLCPSGLPAELFLSCVVADGAARSDENGPAYFGAESYNVTEQLQVWVDSQMRREIARENTQPTSSDVAQQFDEH